MHQSADSARNSLLSRRRLVILLLGILVILAVATPVLVSLTSFPREIVVVPGEERILSFRLPLSVGIRPDREGVVKLNGLYADSGSYLIQLPLAIEPLKLGKVNLDMKLLGLIPFRRLTVNVVPSVEVVPGGQSIGVLLHSQGVLVLQSIPVRGRDGRLHNPARNADIRPGDVILEINGTSVGGKEHVATLIDEAGEQGEPVRFKVERDGQVLIRTINPVFSPEQGKYLVGLWIRDGAAGVGTLTFYHPATRKYVALGHVISDQETGRPIRINRGEIVEASIAGIEKGREGQPGEKLGHFSAGNNPLGSIEANSEFGIIGTLKRLPARDDSTMAIALAYDVKQGPAEIITVLEGTRAERFDVEIERIGDPTHPAPKSLVIKVTDPRLLARTGGIIQGMSGSPIIQAGRLVGAVTHVFINDPTRGYGVFAEWMLRETGLFENDDLGAEQQVSD